ncbi:hypothetical protein [Maritimibacter alexandrii]|uniref:hypothetical protein n=1 Tax=Maritimibacter alexandrii TaxID=2570355 RepID=UPI001107AF7C|nr:hypothetical protein [Maritimibacter alexandrii]
MQTISKSLLGRSTIFVAAGGGNIEVTAPSLGEKPLLCGFLPGAHEGKKLLPMLPPDAQIAALEGVEIVTPGNRVVLKRHTLAAETAANPNPVFMSASERHVARLERQVQGLAQQLTAQERRERKRTAAVKKAEAAEKQPPVKDPELVEGDDKTPDTEPAKKPEKADEKTE